jgi:hypothetical protein
MHASHAMHPKPKCGATRKQTGGACRHPAGFRTSHPGTGRCFLHGGATRNGVTHAALEAAAIEARVMGVPVDVEPHQAILQCIAIANGELMYATWQIGRLQDAMVSTMSGPRLNAWVTVRQKAMDRLVQYAKIAADAKVVVRQVRLAEQQGELIAQVLRGVLTELGIADRPEVSAVVRRQLTMVAQDAA